MSTEIYFTTKEFARRYQISTRTAQAWRYSGEGGPPFVRLGLRRVAYRESDCQVWALSRTYSSRAAEMALHAK